MLSMVSFAPMPSWASCKNSGGSASGHKVGSQVSGGSVTICASAVSVSPARTVVVKAPAKKTVSVSQTPVVKVVAKVVAKPAFRTILKPNPKATVTKVPALLKKPTAKSTKVVSKVPSKVIKIVKPVAKVITKPGSANTTDGSANFVPAAVTGSVYPSNQLSVGQTATFVALATVHYRSGTLLALPTEVRFTPISVDWNFGDGSDGTGSTLDYAFDSVGQQSVAVRVTYQVAYRVKGSLSWIAEPDSISVLDELMVTVIDDEVLSASDETSALVRIPRRVLLVGENCLARPGAFGCN